MFFFLDVSQSPVAQGVKPIRLHIPSSEASFSHNFIFLATADDALEGVWVHKAPNNVCNPKDKDDVRDHALTKTWQTGSYGKEVDIVFHDAIIPCGALWSPVAAWHLPNGAAGNMRNMTPSLSSSNSPLVFGWDLVDLVLFTSRTCFNNSLTAAPNLNFSTILFFSPIDLWSFDCCLDH